MIIRGRLLLDPREKPMHGWVGIDAGRIAEIGSGPPPGSPRLDGDDLLIAPGFIDAHTHLPQFDLIGCDGLDLLGWLREVVYPAEIRWADCTEAREQARRAFRRLMASGTLGLAGFLTSHQHGAEAVRQAHAERPLRSVVGITLMDREAPADLLNRNLPNSLVDSARLTWSVNPRFAISCSERLLQRAADMAKRESRCIQTHVAETISELARTTELFPDDRGAIALLDRFGLLTPRTLLAHGVHLDGDDWQLIAERQSIIVHCPSANTFLQAGTFDIATSRRHGVRLALGSDVAAGPDIAMPRVARAMIEVAKFRRMSIDRTAVVPSPAEAWSMITRGNAEALSWRDAGRIEPGAAADLLVLQPDVKFDQHLMGRLIYGWRDEWIRHVVLDGALHSSESWRISAD
jgi:guanine deaminase